MPDILPIWLSILIVIVAFYLMSEIVDKHFIKSLDNIAKWLKMPHDVAGATLLAFGTSAPEISTALIALFLEDDPNVGVSVGVGTIVGSAIFQILVVIGFAAAVRACILDWKPVTRDSLFYAFSVVLLVIFVHDHVITMYEAIGFVASYFVYLGILMYWTRRVNVKAKENGIDPNHIEEFAPVEEMSEEEQKKDGFYKYVRYLSFPVDYILDLIPDSEKKPQWTIPVFLLSLGVVGYSCYWLVLAAESLAHHSGISPAIIALTVLAGGSSIPEMISSAIVAKQGRGNMAIANAIGSNIFDILMSLGLPVLIYTIWKGDLDLGTHADSLSSSVVLLFGSLIFVFLFLVIKRFKATRSFGYVLIGLYVIYVIAAYTDNLPHWKLF